MDASKSTTAARRHGDTATPRDIIVTHKIDCKFPQHHDCHMHVSNVNCHFIDSHENRRFRSVRPKFPDLSENNDDMTTAAAAAVALQKY